MKTFLIYILSALFATAATYGPSASVGTISDLQARVPVPTSPLVRVLGYHDTNGPIMDFMYEASGDTLPPNRAASGGGAWKFLGESRDARVYGVATNQVDNTAYLQTWVHALQRNKQVGFLPAGRYTYATTLSFLTNNTGIKGDGMFQSVLVYSGSGDAVRVGDPAYNGSTSTLDRWRFENFGIEGSGVVASRVGIRFRGVSALTLDNLRVVGFTTASTNGVGLFFDTYCWDIDVRGGYITANDIGVYATGNGTGGQNSFNTASFKRTIFRVNKWGAVIGDVFNAADGPASSISYGSVFDTCGFEANEFRGLWVASADVFKVVNCYFEHNPEQIIIGNTNWISAQYNQARSIKIEGNWLYASTNANPTAGRLIGIDLQGGSWIKISENHFSGYADGAIIRTGGSIYNLTVTPDNLFNAAAVWPKVVNNFASWNTAYIGESGITAVTPPGETNLNNIIWSGSTNLYTVPLVMENAPLYFTRARYDAYRPRMEVNASQPLISLYEAGIVVVPPTVTNYGTVIPFSSIRSGDTLLRMELGEDRLMFGNGSSVRDVGFRRLSAGVAVTENEWRNVMPNATDIARSTAVTGDPLLRSLILADGTIEIGNGAGARDVRIRRSDSYVLEIDGINDGAVVQLRNMAGIAAPPADRIALWMRDTGIEDLVWTDSSGQTYPIGYVIAPGANMVFTTNTTTRVVTLESAGGGGGGTNGWQIGVNDAIIATPDLESTLGDIKFLASGTNVYANVGTNSVTGAKIVDGTITSNDIASATITLDKLAAPGDTTNFLRADKTWAVPPGGSGSTETLFLNNVQKVSPWKFTNTTSVSWGTNANGDFTASVVGGGGLGTNAFVNGLLIQPFRVIDGDDTEWIDNGAGSFSVDLKSGAYVDVLNVSTANIGTINLTNRFPANVLRLTNVARVLGKVNGTNGGQAEELTITGSGVINVTTNSAGFIISSSGLADGDKVDVTVSGSASVFTINTNAVGFSKFANASAASQLVGRGSAGGAGNFERIGIGTGLAMVGTNLTATGGGSVIQITNDVGWLLRSATTVMASNTVDPTVIATFTVPGNTLLNDGDEIEVFVPAEYQTYSMQTGSFDWDLTGDYGGTPSAIAGGQGGDLPFVSSPYAVFWRSRIKRITETTYSALTEFSIGADDGADTNSLVTLNQHVRDIALTQGGWTADLVIGLEVTLGSTNVNHYVATDGYTVHKIASGGGSGSGGIADGSTITVGSLAGFATTTLATESSTAYTAGDTWTTNYVTLSNVLYTNGGSGFLQSMFLSLAQDTSLEADVLLFSQAPTGIGDANSALSIAAADQPYLLGIRRIRADDYFDLGTNQIADYQGLNIPIRNTSAGKDLFAVIRAVSEVIITNQPTLTVGVLQNLQ